MSHCGRAGPLAAPAGRESEDSRLLAARWQERPPGGESEDSRLLALSVAEGLEGLPMAQRQVLALRYYADLSVRDNAHRLSVPEGTVKSRMHNAVAALGQRLRDMEVI
ncbi:hypothetical protein SUDANB1_00002 [Streptomyces sp. enrichment culture]